MTISFVIFPSTCTKFPLVSLFRSLERTSRSLWTFFLLDLDNLIIRWSYLEQLDIMDTHHNHKKTKLEEERRGCNNSKNTALIIALPQHILEIDEIALKVSLFCDFGTKLILRALTRKLNQIVDRELYQLSKVLLPIKYDDRDDYVNTDGIFSEVHAKVHLFNGRSPEFRSRETFFHNIEDSVYDELKDLSETAVEDGGRLRSAFFDLLNKNALIKLSDFKIVGEIENEIQQMNVQPDIWNHGSLPEITYHEQRAQQTPFKKDWKLTFVQKNVTVRESLKQLTSVSSEENLDEVNTCSLLLILYRLTSTMKKIDIERLKQCFFGLLINANPSSINYFRLSMNDRHVEGHLERGLKGAITFLTRCNDEIELGVEIWLEYESP